MTKPTYDELEAENARLREELSQVNHLKYTLWRSRDKWVGYAVEARYWARQKRQEAEQWKRWYLEVKKGIMTECEQRDSLRYRAWLPSGDPDSIPF